MNNTINTATPGKYRHLVRCSTAQGHFVILAVDHRRNLRESLDQHVATPITDAQFADFKREVIHHLLPQATGVLTDPDFGWAAVVSSEGSAGAGFLAPLEVTDYSQHPSRRATNFIEGWSVEKAKRFGCDGVKLLLYYHPGASNAQGQRDIVARIVDECSRHDIPFFLEPITYSLDAEKPLDNAELQQVVVESAHTFSRMGIDILKAEFPLNVKNEPDESVWRVALQALDAACAVSWTLLSGGVSYSTFKRQVELAREAGASGVIVGRAVWAEAVMLQGEARSAFLRTEGRQRIIELAQIFAQDKAHSWHERIAMPDFRPGWYTQS